MGGTEGGGTDSRMNEPAKYVVDIEELVYLRHGESEFIARFYRPRGAGPFPAVVFAHGGAWVDGDRASSEAIHLPVAAGGVVIMSIEFRVPPQATYPGSVADVNYAVRWLKHHAERFNSRPHMVGTMGTSSGGHLTVLAAMKPHDARYAAIPFAEAPQLDATVKYTVALWPVICPLGRYRDRMAKPAGERVYQNRGGALGNQERYWLTEAAMGEGSPLLALERGDEVMMPNIFYLQNPADELHPRHLMEKFVASYRKAGGNLELEFFEGVAYDAIRHEPEKPFAIACFRKIVEFIQRQAPTA